MHNGITGGTRGSQVAQGRARVAQGYDGRHKGMTGGTRRCRLAQGDHGGNNRCRKRRTGYTRGAQLAQKKHSTKYGSNRGIGGDTKGVLVQCTASYFKLNRVE